MLQDVSGVVSRGFLGHIRLSLSSPCLPVFVYFSHCLRRPISFSPPRRLFSSVATSLASLHTSLAPALRISSFSSFSPTPLAKRFIFSTSWPTLLPFPCEDIHFPTGWPAQWRNPRPSPNPSKSRILSPESIASTLSPHVHYRSSLFSKDHLFITIRLSFIST